MVVIQGTAVDALLLIGLGPDAAAMERWKMDHPQAQIEGRPKTRTPEIRCPEPRCDATFKVRVVPGIPAIKCCPCQVCEARIGWRPQMVISNGADCDEQIPTEADLAQRIAALEHEAVAQRERADRAESRAWHMGHEINGLKNLLNRERAGKEGEK